MKGKSLIAALSMLILSAQMSWAQWTITTSGQVGIGITSPNANSKLHVQHTDFYAGYFTSNKASSTTKVIRAEYTGTGSYNAVAVYGKSAQTASYGWGGFFEGGLVGVAASSTISGSGIRTGVNCAASGGSTANYGILSSGSGGSTNYAGYFSGNVTVTGTFSNPSDDDLKENIDSLRAVLPTLSKLRPISFDFKKTPDLQHMNLAEGKQYGFIAQELEEIFPELVHTERHPSPGELEGKEDEPPIAYKSVNYLALIPILVEAIKEQQEMIEQLQKDVARLGQK